MIDEILLFLAKKVGHAGGGEHIYIYIHILHVCTHGMCMIYVYIAHRCVYIYIYTCMGVYVYYKGATDRNHESQPIPGVEEGYRKSCKESTGHPV